MSDYNLSYKDAAFAMGEQVGMTNGAIKILVAQIKAGRNDVTTAAQDVEMSVEEFLGHVHRLFPDEVLPE